MARLRLSSLESRLVPAGRAELISTAAAGMASATAGGESEFTTGSLVVEGTRQISADGRYLVFTSNAANVVVGQADGNGVYDVFLYDRVSQSTALISRRWDSPTTTGNDDSGDPAISHDGRYVAFRSRSTDLVEGFVGSPTPIDGWIYVYDRVSGLVALVNHRHDSVTAGSAGVAQPPRISADGQWIAYQSKTTTDLIDGFVYSSGGPNDMYLYEVATGKNTLVSHAVGEPLKSGGTNTQYVQISADGRYVTFDSSSKTLIAGGTGMNWGGVFQYDRTDGSVKLLTHAPGAPTTYVNANSSVLSASADGARVVIGSNATDLVTGFIDINGTMAGDVFLYDRATDGLTLVTHATGTLTAGANDLVLYPKISEDGSAVVFETRATNLIANFIDGNGAGESDVYVYDVATGDIALVSRAAGAANVASNAGAGTEQISGNGRWVVYAAYGSDLVPGFVDGNNAADRPYMGPDVYVFDRLTGENRLVNHVPGLPAVGGNGLCENPVISSDGQWVAFTSFATDLVAGLADRNAFNDMFLWQRDSNITVLASPSRADSVTAGGNTSSSYNSSQQRVSDDGRFVVYSSNASNAVPGQVDGKNEVDQFLSSNDLDYDVFLYDRVTNTTTLVSHKSGESSVAANGASTVPVISGDGRFVAYLSEARDLVSGFVDNNGPPVSGYSGTDVYLYDRLTGLNTLVSHQVGSTTAGSDRTSGRLSTSNWEIAISRDGKYLTYLSQAQNLIDNFVDGNGDDSTGLQHFDVFLFDRISNANVLVSRAAGTFNAGSSGDCQYHTISTNGNDVLFTSNGTNVVTGFEGGAAYQIYHFDPTTQSTTLVTASAVLPGEYGNGRSFRPQISSDGRYVLFESGATNLIAGGQDTNAAFDVYLHDRTTGVTKLVSHAVGSPLIASNRLSSAPAMSSDGRFVVFGTAATNIVNGFIDANGTNIGDVYLYDAMTSENALVSHSSIGLTQGSATLSSRYAVSASGRIVVFHSSAIDIVPGQNQDGRSQLFIYDRLAGDIKVGIAASGPSPAPGVGGPLVSGPDGLIFLTSNLYEGSVPGDWNGHADLFAYLTTTTIAAVTIDEASPQRSTIRSLTLTFDQPITFIGDPAAAFELAVGGVQLAVNTGPLPTSSVTITFTGAGTQFGSLPDGDYTLRVLAAQVIGAGPLDGNNDGIAGDDYLFSFHRLFGDSDGDRDVDVNDFAAFRMSFGGSFTIFDFDNDGDVDAGDFGAFRVRFGVMI